MYSSLENHGSKIIPFITAAIILVLVGVGSYALGTKKSQTAVENKVFAQPSPTQTPDSTANWKTYINTKVGFQLKYPARYPQPGLPSGNSLSSDIYTKNCLL